MRARLTVRLSRQRARVPDLYIAPTQRPPLPRVQCSSHSTSVRDQALRLGLSSPLPGASASDPLIEFLERNQEDATLMLAMWTSLRRCCLHASEISESLSLGARWFLHHLIHRRAIAAAVGFYHRLVELGVQLQRWDVAVLLSNLPYEHTDPVCNDRQKRTPPRRFGAPQRQSGGGGNIGKKEAEDSAARERVRRWALYEASMGHVELRSADSPFPTTSSSPSSSSGSSSMSAVYCGDGIGTGGLRARLRHLLLLDEAAPRALRAGRCSYAGEALREALRCLRAEDARGAVLSPPDCALFFRLAADPQPWLCNAAVERFVARAVAPRLSEDCAAALGAQAVWRAHLCRVRALRPRDYDRLAHLCDAAAALPAAVRSTAAKAKIAVAHLRVEIARDEARRRAIASTAASIRAGLFTDEHHLAAPPGSDDKNHSNNNNNNNNSTYDEGGGGGWDDEEGSDVPGTTRRDAFVLVCVAVRRVVPLVAAAAAASHADALALHALLADTVLGRVGLCAVFAEAFAHDAVAQAALAHCLLRSAAALCEAANVSGHGNGRGSGSGENVGRAARHLLCAAAKVLSPLPQAAPCASPVQSRSRAWCAADRAALAIARGGLSGRDAAAANAALALVCMRLRASGGRSSDHSSDRRKNRRHCRRSHRGRKCGVGRSRPALGAGTLLRLRASLLRPGGRALTAAARDALPDALSRAEVTALLCAGGRRGRRRPPTKTKTGTGTGALMATGTESGGKRAEEGGGPRFFSPEEAQRIDAVADVRRAVHDAALRAGADDAALRGALLALTAALPADRAALVPLVARRVACLRSSAIGLDLYAAALCRVSQWDEAAELLRDAAATYTATATATATETTGIEETTEATKAAEITERDVLTALLLPLLRACVRSGRVDAGRAVLRHWEEKYSGAERDTQREALRIRAFAALRDGRALAMCRRFITAQCADGPCTDELEALLCEVALSHADWRQALDAMVSICGAPPQPYSSRVASAVMLLLCRAPRNLSATALQVRAGQGAAWDLANAGRLVLLLARQRRWQAALAHVAEMLPAVDRAGAAGTPRERAALLLHGLRACAIGGRGDDAAALYDRMKALAAAPEAAPSTPSQQKAHPQQKVQMEALVEALLDPTESSVGAEGDDMRLLVAQARLYFIRAMTKKSLHM